MKKITTVLFHSSSSARARTTHKTLPGTSLYKKCSIVRRRGKEEEKEKNKEKKKRRRKEEREEKKKEKSAQSKGSNRCSGVPETRQPTEEGPLSPSSTQLSNATANAPSPQPLGYFKGALFSPSFSITTGQVIWFVCRASALAPLRSDRVGGTNYTEEGGSEVNKFLTLAF